MRHGKYQSPRRKTSLALWIFLILAVLGMSFGGARAYLSASTDPVSNRFTVANYPTISLNSDNSVTVTDSGYTVYLRAAVVVNWQSTTSSGLLASVPVEGTDYALAAGANWFKHTDGFYYYKLPIQSGTTEPAVTLTSKTAKIGYDLVANVAVQTIQAVGTTDTGNKPAVEAAWGITPTEISGS